jgi:hypothetical protein
VSGEPEDKVITTEDEDAEVEAHKKLHSASDEPAAEGESDDDFEAHKKLHS